MDAFLRTPCQGVVLSGFLRGLPRRAYGTPRTGSAKGTGLIQMVEAGNGSPYNK